MNLQGTKQTPVVDDDFELYMDGFDSEDDFPTLEDLKDGEIDELNQVDDEDVFDGVVKKYSKEDKRDHILQKSLKARKNLKVAKDFKKGKKFKKNKYKHF